MRTNITFIDRPLEQLEKASRNRSGIVHSPSFDGTHPSTEGSNMLTWPLIKATLEAANKK